MSRSTEILRAGRPDHGSEDRRAAGLLAAAIVVAFLEGFAGRSLGAEEDPQAGQAASARELIEQAVTQAREEAARMADEAEEAAEEAARAAEREAEELADYEARQDCLRAAVAAAKEAVAAASGWRLLKRPCSHDSSRYHWLLGGGSGDDDYEQALSLRISDHYTKNGSGWNEAKQTQHDEPDVNIVIRRGAGGEYTFDLTPLVETLDR